jgi:hypothetical protein
MAPNKSPRRPAWLADQLGVKPPSMSDLARSQAAKAEHPLERLSPMEVEARRQAAADLTGILPPDLQQEQPTIIMGRFDEVTALSEQFNLHARRLGTKYGIHGHEFVLERNLHEPKVDDSNFLMALKLFTGVMAGVYMPRESFQLTRVGDAGWGIYYRYAPALVVPQPQQRGQELVQPLAGCGIDMKREFIRRADQFFASYLRQVRGTVTEIDQDLSVGKDVLKALDQIE